MVWARPGTQCVEELKPGSPSSKADPPQPFPKDKFGKLEVTDPPHESQGHHIQPSFPEQVQGPVRKTVCHGRGAAGLRQPTAQLQARALCLGATGHLRLAFASENVYTFKGLSLKGSFSACRHQTFFSRIVLPCGLTLEKTMSGEAPLVLLRKGGATWPFPRR